MKESRMSTRYMAAVAMFAAVSYVAVLVSKVIPNVAGFLSYEPKDAVIVIAGLLYGPLTSVLISVIVSFIEMITISSTYYQKHRTQKDAVIGLTFGVVAMVAAMLLWNYIITPFYMGVPREQVAGMLMTVFLPFNLTKGGINAGLTLLLYKPIVNALRKAHLAEPSKSGEQKGRFNIGFTLFALAILVTFILLFLVLIGVL